MNKHVVLSVAHLVLIVPFLLYVAFQRAASPDWLYWLAFGIGLVVFMVHAVKAAYRWTTGSTYIWVNLLHVVIVAPLLIFIGYYGKKTPRPAYELLAMTAFAALGYHMYNILNQLQVVDES